MLLSCGCSTIGHANAFERALYRACTLDETVLRAFEGVGSRRRSPVTMLDPRVLARLVRCGRRPQSLVPLAQPEVATERPATGAPR